MTRRATAHHTFRFDTRLPWRLVVIALASIALVAPARADWSHNPALNTPICTISGSQQSPVALADGAGGVFLAWSDPRGLGLDVYAQHVDANGTPLWTVNGVPVCAAASDQTNIRMVLDGAGGVIFSWQDFRSGNWDVFAQRLNAAGSPVWPLNGVGLCVLAGTQSDAAIATDGASGAIVSWQDNRSGTNDIYAQRVNAAGAPAWAGNGAPVCNFGFNQYGPAMVSDAAGGAVIVWTDARLGNDDIFVQRIDASGTPLWTANGVSICISANTQVIYNTRGIISDGAGGFILVWDDLRSGTAFDVYAQRITPAGVSQWTSGGVAVGAAAGEQFAPDLVADGSGGAIFGFYDARSGTADLYAQRVGGNGLAVWTANGIPISTGSGTQWLAHLVSDGVGGAILQWEDNRTGGTDLFAQRVNASGSTLWAVDGVALCTAFSSQTSPWLASDGQGGAIAVWQDLRTGVADIHAQRIQAFGVLGSPEPSIVGVTDVPNDQGSQVKLSWNGSWLDTELPALLDHYWILRSVPPNVAEQALAAGARLVRPSDPAPRRDESVVFAIPTASSVYYWEHVGTQSALHFTSNYSFVTATTGDSAAASNPTTAFLVAGFNADHTTWYVSTPATGYSVDNLPPAAPAPFTGQYGAGATALHWDPNAEPDVALYRLYRGNSAGFVPGPGSLVSEQPDTGYVDPGPAGNWYKLSAVDAHGNESVFAVLSPAGTVDAPDGDAPRELWLAAPSPNPSRGATLLRLGLPVAGRVMVSIHDASGRLVRTVHDGALAAGEHTLRWDARAADGGRAPSGLYFVRLSSRDRVLHTRLVSIR